MPIILSCVFLGLILGIAIGAGLTLWYANSVFDSYEQEILELKTNSRQKQSLL